MGLERICECCGAPISAFTKTYGDKYICLRCHGMKKAGVKEVTVFQALGALHSTRYKGDKLAAKTRSLIKHDRILRGER